MRGFVVLALAAASAVWSSAAAFADDRMPYGTFTCQVLMASSLSGYGDQFVPSVLGTFVFDGAGNYTRQGKSGSVVVEYGVVKFTSGEAEGIVAVLKQDPRGRGYLHIDGEVTVPPAGDPKQADFVCYQQ